jgi:glycyl-tRNA synthetase alpha chain
VELTYGLERIAMYLQNKKHAYEVEYAPGVTLGDLRRDFEYQHSDYNFNYVNAELQRTLFDAYESEAKRLLEKALIYPAYEFVMKASHAFNLLDARGVLSQAERQGYVQRVRRIAEASAKGYLEMLEKNNPTAKAA